MDIINTIYNTKHFVNYEMLGIRNVKGFCWLDHESKRGKVAFYCTQLYLIMI